MYFSAEITKYWAGIGNKLPLKRKWVKNKDYLIKIAIDLEYH